MELKDVKVGQRVKVVVTQGFEPESKGYVGVVVEVEPLLYDGILTVHVDFDDVEVGVWQDWGNHADLELIEDV